MSSLRAIVMLSLQVLFCVSQIDGRAEAADKLWNNAAGGIFNDGTNWSPSGAPGPSDNAIFNLSAVYPVTFNVDPDNVQAIIHQGGVTFDLAGHTYDLTLSTGTDRSFVVGRNAGDDASLVVKGGTLATNKAAIGWATGSTGDLTIDGPSAAWAPAEFVHVGLAGTGSLTVKNSGTVTAADRITIGSTGEGTLLVQSGGSISSREGFVTSGANAIGMATITGTGSSWTTSGIFVVGNQQGSDGSLTISDGGVVQNANVFVGAESGAAGSAIVTGANSLWESDDDLTIGQIGAGSLTIADFATVTVADRVRIGNVGSGTLLVQSAGMLTSFDGFVSAQPGSTGDATVTGVGSSWTNDSILVVGNATGGSGTLIIADGGSVSNTNGLIGVNTGSSGAVSVTGTDSNWVNSGQLVVGAAGSGSLTVENGGMVTAQLMSPNPSVIVARDELSDGKITLNGPSSRLSAASQIWIGRRGTGVLEILGGATVQSSVFAEVGSLDGSMGTVLVDGDNSAWHHGADLFVGNNSGAFGDVTISNGGLISTTGESALGNNAATTGMARVIGPGSVWNAGVFVVGRSGTGFLEVRDQGSVSTGLFAVGTNASGNGTVVISNGGQMMSSASAIGFGPGSTGGVTVTGMQSDWEDLEGVAVGLAGNGALTISDQAIVTTPWLGIAALPGATGNVTVTGVSTMLDITRLPDYTVAETGQLHVGGFDSLDHAAIGSLTGGPGGTGTLHVLNGATVVIPDLLKVWNAGAVVLDGGAVTIGNGPLETTADTLRVWENGTLAGAGLIVGNVESKGTVSLGTSFGALSILGNYTQESEGFLQVDIGGQIPISEFDVLDVSGPASLNGAVLISLQNDFFPDIGDTFEIISAGFVVGEFDQPIPPSGSIQWDVIYGTTTVTLVVTAIPEPGGLLLAGIGVAVLALCGRRRFWHPCSRYLKGLD